MIKLFFSRANWIVSLFLFLIVACSSTPSSLPTNEPSDKSSLTLSPSPTVTSTVTPTTVRATKQPSHTMTPLPTLLPVEAKELIHELLTNNAGCKLPCWWGITPGETTWETASQFLSSFVTSIEQGGTGRITENRISYEVTNYSALYPVEGFQEEGHTNYALRNGLVTWIKVDPEGNEQGFELYQVLEDYGKPEAISIQAHSFTGIENYLPFRFFLYYPNNNFFAFYNYPIAEKTDNALRWCPQPGIGPELWMWSSEIEIINDELIELVLGIEAGDLGIPLPIQDVTDSNIDLFYQTYINQTTEVCLDTPADLWP